MAVFIDFVPIVVAVLAGHLVFGGGVGQTLNLDWSVMLTLAGFDMLC
jgi:hypothetical protein